MIKMDAKAFDGHLKWRATSKKRQQELKVLLSKFHLEDVFAGRTTITDSITLFSKALEESRRRYANPADWATWVSEQSVEAKRIEQSMFYAVASGSTGATVSHDGYVELPLTKAEGYLRPNQVEVGVPAYPECYKPHLNWAASDWILLNELGTGVYPRQAYFPSIDRLSKPLKILGTDKLAEDRYCVLQMAYALTDPENPDQKKYQLDRPIPGKRNQISKPLRKELDVRLPFFASTMARWLKQMDFELYSELRSPKLKS